MAICLGSAISYLISSSHVIFATSTWTCARTIELALRRAIAKITSAVLLRAAPFGVLTIRHKDLGLQRKMIKRHQPSSLELHIQSIGHRSEGRADQPM